MRASDHIRLGFAWQCSVNDFPKQVLRLLKQSWVFLNYGEGIHKRDRATLDGLVIVSSPKRAVPHVIDKLVLLPFRKRRQVRTKSAQLQCEASISPFDIGALPALMADRIEQAVLASEPPAESPGDPWIQLIKYFRERLNTNGFPKAGFLSVAGPTLEEIGRQIQHYRQQYQQVWTDDFLPRLRVFSVSELKDELLMWAHYGRDHTGAVLEFLSLPHLDNPLSVATPVEYCVEPPPFSDQELWLQNLFDISRDESSALYYRYARAKSEKWAYEREWRVWYLGDKGTVADFENMPVRQEELAAVYLGCRASQSTQDDVRTLARMNFPSAAVFKARKSPSKYALEFDPVAP